MTEIDVEAEQIYAMVTVVAHVGDLFRYLRLGRINNLSTRIIQINIALSSLS